MSVQVKVALHKERAPEKFCPARKCLWHTGGGTCPRHTPKEEPCAS
jgi:hypothetical protein